MRLQSHCSKSTPRLPRGQFHPTPSIYCKGELLPFNQNHDIHLLLMKGTNFTGYPELRELQETLESRVRQNMRQELGQIVQSAVADALQKIFPNGMVQKVTTDSGVMPESLPSTSRPKRRTKQLPRPRPSNHNTFKVNEQRTNTVVVLLMSC